jgi:hypothetical protein
MPIEFRYDEVRGILFTTAEGVVSFDDVWNHIEREAREGDLTCKELFDATNATTNMTPGEVRHLAESIRGKLDRSGFGPTAIVTRNDVFFGMSRMLEICSELQDGPKFGVFREATRALRWLEALVDNEIYSSQFDSKRDSISRT